MHPLARALLSSWEWRPEVLAVIVPLGLLYLLGWRRLRRQSVHHKLANWWRLSSYLGGLGFIALSLMSPIDRLGSQLFFMHMIQHMLTIMFAAPLLLLADPFPFVLWALPTGLRLRIAGLFTRDSGFRRMFAKVTQPGVAWLVFLTVYLGWHDADAYNAALYYKWVHDFQHITFFLAALLYWWPIIGSAPHIHPRFPAWGKLVYLIGTVPPNMFVGVSIAFASDVIYTYYLSIPRIWGFSTIEDQQLSGAIMWIVGSQMFIMVALFILARLFQRSDKDKITPQEWDSSEEAMIAPGLEHRVVQNRWHKVTERTIDRTIDRSASRTPSDISQST